MGDWAAQNSKKIKKKITKGKKLLTKIKILKIQSFEFETSHTKSFNIN